MKISQAEWNDYIFKLSLISDRASNDFKKWAKKNGGWENINRQELVEMAYDIADRYAEASSTLSAEMYEIIANRENVKVKPAEIYDNLDFAEIAKGVNGALKHSNNDNYISSVVGRAVKQASADTMLKNASRDGAEFAWIPSGDTCGFCLMLASRGWQKATKKTTNGNHAEHIHTNCNCQFAIRFNKNSNVEGYDPEEYFQKYEEAKQAVLNEGEKATTNNIANKMRYIQKSKREEEIAKAKEAFEKEKSLIGNRPLKDNTSKWKEDYKNNIPQVDIPSRRIEYQGVKYTIDGNNIENRHNEEELKTAILLSKALGKKVSLCPKISGTNTGIQTPDYLIGDEQQRWDRKGLHGNSDDAIRNAIKRKEKQADNFIIDIKDYKNSKENALEQAKKVFEYSNTRFVNNLAIVEGDEILLVLKR